MGNVTANNYNANSRLTHVKVSGELNDISASAGNVRLSEVNYVYDEMDRLLRTEQAFFDTQTQTPIMDGLAVTETVIRAGFAGGADY
ncbi:MAG: hypothetical protein IPK83_17065 [Planctomycetes bacterium]|nr:hypothetical protein [Planctomycetota bacterium]